MSWIRVDDHFADHPKVMALETDRLSGLGLWHAAASYCARHLTDGFVPAHYMKAQAPAKLVNRLVRVGLFDTVDGGYQLHDWLDYNPPREKVLAERAAAKERMNKGRSSPEVRPNNERTDGDVREKFDDPVPVPTPVPVSPVTDMYVEPFVEPAAFYQEKARRKSLSKKELDWIEDLHARFSRKELVRALQAVEAGPDFLKRVDAYLEAA